MPISGESGKTIGILTAADMHPWDDDTDENGFIKDAIEKAEDDSGGTLTGLNACNSYQDGMCLPLWARYDYDGTYPLFDWGFWWKDALETTDLTKIGIFHSNANGSPIYQDDGSTVKWIAEDDDCMLGAPQLVDLQNGRFLVGYGKFQCISDGFKLRRFATTTTNTRSVATLVPSEYYLMEIDSDGEIVVEPTRVSGSGWGGVDRLISIGEGKAAWAYIPNPELTSEGDYPEPNQNAWELLIYESSAQ